MFRNIARQTIHLIVKIANANNNNNNKNENNNNNNDNNNNNVHEQTFLKINMFTNMYGMMFMGLGREFPDFPDYPDYIENSVTEDEDKTSVLANRQIKSVAILINVLRS